MPPGIGLPSLTEAANYVSRQFAGLTLAEAHLSLQQDIDAGRAALDSASRQLVERGLAIWSADSEHRPVIIVRGQANLIDESATEHLRSEETRLNFSH